MHPYTAEPESFRNVGRPATLPVAVSEKEVFAVVQVGSLQFRVTPDDLIFVEKLNGCSVNDKAAPDQDSGK